MATRSTQQIVWTGCRGRDGWSPPQEVPSNFATEAINVHFYEGGLCTKRGGITSVTLSPTTLTTGVGLTSWVPNQDPAERELFIVDAKSGGGLYRIADGTATAAVTLLGSPDFAGTRMPSFAALNGKLFLAAPSEARLQVYDTGFSTTAMKWVGLGVPAAATVANTGSGSYAATLRYYRVAYTEQQSSVTIRRSELSASVSFTPSGTGTHARVTKPASISEGETHWELYASEDDVTYYGPIATTAVGTTTYDDNVDPADYADTYELAPTEGENKPFPGCRYLYSNGFRLFGFGKPESTSTATIAQEDGTIYFSPALDSSEIADEERCRDTVDAVGKVVVGRNAGGVDRGIAGLGNMIVAFQSQGIYSLVPTENADVPYRRVQYSDSVGAVSHHSIVTAEDEAGRPCLYFLDPLKGPYRLGHDGLRWVGKDVKDIWDTVTLDTATTTFWPHGTYYQAKRQVWFWVNKSGSAAPSCVLILDIPQQREDEEGDLRGGWSQHDGTLATARASCVMSSTLGDPMTLALIPYITMSSTVYKCDQATSDNVQAYIQSGGFELDIISNHQVDRSYLLAEAASGVTITQTFVRNFGDETNRTDTVSLTAAGSETRVLRKFEASALQDAYLFQVRLGDASASTSAWTLDRWVGVVEQNEVR